MDNSLIGRGNLIIVRNDRIGDAILALPVVTSLRKQFPEARIHFWAAPNLAPLIRCVEGIDSVLVSDDRGGIDISGELASLDIQTGFCLRPTFTNAWSLKKAHIAVRIGTARRYYSPLFTHKVNISRRQSLRHEADLNLDLLTAVGIKGNTDFPEIRIPETACVTIEGMLNRTAADKNKSLIVIHPGSGGSARNWPITYFKELADRLSSNNPARIVVTGSGDEDKACRQVAGSRHLNLYGMIDLIELAALLKRAALLITNSTGPLHLAVAMGRKVLGLYPPLKDCLPDRWGPYLHPEWALTPDLPLCIKCHPGSVSSCYCMEQLSPDTVFWCASRLLME